MSKNNKYNNNNNYKKHGHKRDPRTQNFDVNNQKGGKCQDPFWYAKTEEEIKSIASFPWNTIIGEPFFDNGSFDVIPGIVTLPYIPTMGSSINETGANNLTKAADAYYQAVSQGISGGYSEFEAPDLLFTALCGAQLISKMIEAKRAFGISNNFETDNAYLARGVLAALGVDYDSFNGTDYTRLDFISDYNLRVDQINKIIAIPKNLTIADRWDYLNSWIFADTSAGVRSTLYAYVPSTYWIYDDTTYTTGTAIAEREPRGSILANGLRLRTARDIFSDIDDMINALTGDDQRAMFAAIRRVYDESQLKTLSYLDDKWNSEIVRNDIVSIAIHNAEFAEIAGFRTGEENNLIGAYPVAIQLPDGSISSVPSVVFNVDNTGTTAREFLQNDQIILDSFDAKLTPGQALDAIAHKMPIIRSVLEEGNEENENTPRIWSDVAPRSEILTYPIVTYFTRNAKGVLELIHENVLTFLPSSAADGAVIMTNAMQIFTHLNAAPLFMKYYPVDERIDGSVLIQQWSLCGYVGEIDEYTFISANSLKRSHNKAIYNMIQMPFGSKSVSR